MKRKNISYDCSNVSVFDRNSIVRFCLKNCYRWDLEMLTEVRNPITKIPNKNDVIRELNNSFHFGILINGAKDVMGTEIKFHNVTPVEVYFISERASFSAIMDMDHLKQFKKQFKLTETKNE